MIYTKNYARLIGWKRMHFSCNTSAKLWHKCKLQIARALPKFRLSVLSAVLFRSNNYQVTWFLEQFGVNEHLSIFQRLQFCCLWKFYTSILHQIALEIMLLPINISSICFICFCRDFFQVLKYTAGHINYGGRVTDDWDRRCIMNILNDFYSPDVLSSEHKFSESGIYHQLPLTSDHEVFSVVWPSLIFAIYNF